MSTSPGAWPDLVPRILTGATLALVCISALFAGGMPLLALVAVLGAVMIWELIRIIAPYQKVEALSLALLAALGIAMFGAAPGWVGLVIMLAVPVLGTLRVGAGHRGLFFLYALFILLGVMGLFLVRNIMGLYFVMWLVSIVVVSDLAGYFAGRLIGGPKFWPAISPKKTWSGTVAGWVCAGVLAAAMAPTGIAVFAFVLLSVVLAFAAQMGDIAESAIKRRYGVKDSSNLLPGHGGVLDRFDGMIAVFALTLTLWVISLVAAGNL